MHPRRSKFFLLISQGRTVEQAVAVCLYVPFWRRVLSIGKRGVKKVVKLVLGDAGVKGVAVLPYHKINSYKQTQ